MNQILIISKEANKILTWLQPLFKKYDVLWNLAEDGISGIEKYTKYTPCLVFIDCQLPDFNGMSLASIIKDTEDGEKSSIYLYNTEKILHNTKADYFFLTLDEQELKVNMYARVEQFLENHFMKKQHSSEIERAKINQYERLPDNMNHTAFQVNILFSPFAELSGDGLDYWIGEDETGLYGFIFDCTGHDIVSFTMAGQIRTLLKKACRVFQMGIMHQLSDVMADVNHDLFDIDVDPIPTAAIVFYIDLRENILRYCTAGIPAFYVRQEKQLKAVPTRNYLLGYEPEVEYTEKRMSLKEVDEIIFSSDGFSELLFGQLPKKDMAKHDDVSAILIRLKRS